MEQFRISKGVDDFKRVYYVEKLVCRRVRYGFLWINTRKVYKWEYVKDMIIVECGFDYFVKSFKTRKKAEKYIKLFN